MDSATSASAGTGASQIAHVLAPLDGSARAEAVLGWLPLLPIQRLTLLHVRDEDSPELGEATRYLEEIASRPSPPGCTVETRVVTGCAADSIVAAAAGVDLVVMSTRGAGGGGRLLFGSVADRVARHSPSPTLLLRGGSAPVSAEAVRRVVVPLDGSANAERALPLALTLAATLACPIHLTTVIEEAAAKTARRRADGYLERHAEQLASRGVQATTERRSGSAAEELLAAVAPGDLLVITTHGQGEARRWQIGRVAEKLLRQAAAPVVLVRADSP